MTSQSAKELVDKLNNHKVEASKLRNALNELDKEKESWFRKKEEHSSKIKEAIKEIKEDKAKRDSLTQEVKELKQKRDSINKELSSKSSELDKLKKERASLSKSLNTKVSPSRIKENIEKLEFKIETEPMSFDKEQSIMKKIKEMKKMYSGLSAVIEADKKYGEASDYIRKMRKEANESHKLIQEKARQSQALHQEILEISAEIDKIKADEEEAFKKFSEFKKDFNETNAKLKEKLREMNDARGNLDKISSERKEKKRIEEESFLKSKEEEVNNKIKRREKITTEDLLVFQQKFGKG